MLRGDVALLAGIGLHVEKLPRLFGLRVDVYQVPARGADGAVEILRGGDLAVLPSTDVREERALRPRRSGIVQERNEAASLALRALFFPKLRAGQLGERGEKINVGGEVRAVAGSERAGPAPEARGARAAEPRRY